MNIPFSVNGKADPKAMVIKGNCRFTVLTDRFLRLEYAPDGQFEDRQENMDTWRKMSLAFLNRFFPPSKTNAIRHQIHNFTQKHDESMAEAWERFNEIQRSCPHHNIEKWSLLQIFYGGLNQHDKQCWMQQ